MLTVAARGPAARRHRPTARPAGRDRRARRVRRDEGRAGLVGERRAPAARSTGHRSPDMWANRRGGREGRLQREHVVEVAGTRTPNGHAGCRGGSPRGVRAGQRSARRACPRRDPERARRAFLNTASPAMTEMKWCAHHRGPSALTASGSPSATRRARAVEGQARPQPRPPGQKTRGGPVDPVSGRGRLTTRSARMAARPRRRRDRGEDAAPGRGSCPILGERGHPSAEAGPGRAVAISERPPRGVPRRLDHDPPAPHGQPRWTLSMRRVRRTARRGRAWWAADPVELSSVASSATRDVLDRGARLARRALPATRSRTVVASCLRRPTWLGPRGGRGAGPEPRHDRRRKVDVPGREREPVGLPHCRGSGRPRQAQVAGHPPITRRRPSSRRNRRDPAERCRTVPRRRS